MVATGFLYVAELLFSIVTRRLPRTAGELIQAARSDTQLAERNATLEIRIFEVHPF
jgi:hypothetical protein